MNRLACSFTSVHDREAVMYLDLLATFFLMYYPVWGWCHWPKGQIYVQFVANRILKDFSERTVPVQLVPVCLVAEGYSIPNAGLYICLCGMYEVPVNQFLQPVKVTLKSSSPASQPLLRGLVSSTNLLSVLYSIIKVVIKDIKQYQPSIIASGIPIVTNKQLNFVLLSTNWD